MISGRHDIPKRAAARALELENIYKGARIRIREELKIASITSFREFRLKEQLRQINAIVAALTAASLETADGVIPAFYKSGADLTAEALSEQGVKASRINMGNLIHTRAVNSIADQMASDLTVAAQSLGKVATRILRQTQQTLIAERNVNETIARGVVGGEARRETSERLREQLADKLEKGGKIEILSKDGKIRAYDVGRYAELVTRTQTREAVTQGALNFGAEYDVVNFQVSVHASSCPVCLPFQGKVYSTVMNGDFPFLNERPPYHPFCRHVLLAYVDNTGREHEQLLKFSRSKDQVRTVADYGDRIA